jgi:hypothetical protein
MAGRTTRKRGQSAEKFAAWTRGRSDSLVYGLYSFPPNALRVEEFRLLFPGRQLREELEDALSFVTYDRRLFFIKL